MSATAAEGCILFIDPIQIGEDGNEVVCEQPTKIGWVICEGCYSEMLSGGDFTHKELLDMYGPDRLHL